MKTVSVIIPFLRDDSSLRNCVESALSNLEYICEIILICDDPSVDTNPLKLKYDTGLVKIYKNESNFGAGYSRRRGIALATGRYISFLDADDKWLPGKLAAQITALEDPRALGCCTSIKKINGNKKISLVCVPRIITYKMLLRKNYIPMSSAIIKSEHIHTDWMTNLKRRQDYVFWMLGLKNNPTLYFIGLEKVYVEYNVTKGSLSSNPIKNVIYNYLAFRVGMNFSVLFSLKSLLVNILYKVFA